MQSVRAHWAVLSTMVFAASCATPGPEGTNGETGGADQTATASSSPAQDSTGGIGSATAGPSGTAAGDAPSSSSDAGAPTSDGDSTTTGSTSVPPECPVVGDMEGILSGRTVVESIEQTQSALERSLTDGEFSYLAELRWADLSAEQALRDPVVLKALQLAFPFAVADCPEIELVTQEDLLDDDFQLEFTVTVQAWIAAIGATGLVGFLSCTVPEPTLISKGLCISSVISLIALLSKAGGATEIDPSLATCPAQALDYASHIGPLPPGCEHANWPDCPGCVGLHCGGCSGTPAQCPTAPGPGYGDLGACSDGTCGPAPDGVCFAGPGCCPAGDSLAPPCNEPHQEAVSGPYVTCWQCECQDMNNGGTCIRATCFAP